LTHRGGKYAVCIFETGLLIIAFASFATAGFYYKHATIFSLRRNGHSDRIRFSDQFFQIDIKIAAFWFFALCYLCFCFFRKNNGSNGCASVPISGKLLQTWSDNDAKPIFQKLIISFFAFWSGEVESSGLNDVTYL
jgi:hypothetical protein